MFSVEETIQSFLTFAKKFVLTTYNTLFRPFRLYCTIKRNEVDGDLLSPFIYLFLCIIIYVVAYKTRTSDLVQLSYYANFQRTITEYSFAENVFIIFPILLIFYTIIRAYIWVFRLNQYEGGRVINLPIYEFNSPALSKEGNMGC